MPASLTYPGVYIEELPSNVHTIAGVATSIAAFIGWAPQGPTDKAVLVQSFTEFQSIFGTFTPGIYLAYAVNHFFANGGSQAYIVRLVWEPSLTPAPGTNPAVAQTALATGVGSAVAQITATSGSLTSAPVTVSIGTPALQRLVIAPAHTAISATPPSLPPLPNGTVIGLQAVGIFADGSVGAPPAAVKWQSSNPAVVSVDTNSGVATALSKGTATITASSSLVSATMSVTASAAGLAPAGAPALVISPSSIAALADGQTVQLTATAKYLDGTQQDVTAIARWSSSSTTSAIVGNGDANGPPGLVTATGTSGSANITADCFAPSATPNAPIEGQVTVTAATAAVTAITIFPANPTTNVGQPVTFSAFATMTDGTQSAVSSGAWTSNATSVANITMPGNVPTATPVANGSATITVTQGTVSASATLTVTAATLNAITVSPQNGSTPVWHPSAALRNLPSPQLQMTALGVYSDGTTVDLTRSVKWSSGGAAATVDPNTGLVTGVSVSSATQISASPDWQSALVGSANVAVTARVPEVITVSSAGSSAGQTVVLPGPGQTAQLIATATFSDGGTAPLGNANWSSSAPTIVSVDPNTGVAAAAASGGSLTLFASSAGAWGNTLLVTVLAQPSDPSRFGLLVQQTSPSGQISTLESFANLSTTPTDPQYAVTVIDNDSNYITFVNPATNAAVIPASAPSPTPGPIGLSGGADGAKLIPASDQNFELALLNPTGGASLLDRVDIFNLLCVPGETDQPTISSLQAYCARKRAMLIVDAPQTATVASLAGSGPVGTNSGGAGITQLPNATNSAYYFPWVLAPDPVAGNRPTLFPPCGFVAGIFAATDAARGVWKAPAGVNAGLTGNSGLQFALTDLENGDLNPQAINCLRQFKIYGDVVWGARTLAGNDQVGSQWKYIPIRRLALYLESSLFDGTQWVVFEPNDEPLWGQIRLNVGAFMQGLFLEGAFAGSTPSQAYFVKCDADNNPPASVALGVVNILVGFAPLYPAEFVVIQIQQIAAQAS